MSEQHHMEMGANASGSGKLTAAMMKDFLDELPGEAVLTIFAHNDQRDGDIWSIRAVWGQSGEKTSGGTKITNFTPPRDDHRATDVRFQAYQEGQIGDPISRPNDWSNPYKGQFGDH